MNQSVKKYLLPSLITAAIAFVYYYLALPAINLRSGEFWGMLFVLFVTFVASFLGIGNPGAFKKLSKWLSEANTGAGFQNKKSKGRKNDYVVDDSITIPNWIKISLIVFACVITLVIILCFT